MTGFVAKEAVISSWAQTYAVSDAEQGADTPLGQSIRRDFEASSEGHTVPAVLAFMAFLLAYTPCVATLAAQRRGGLRLAAGEDAARRRLRSGRAHAAPPAGAFSKLQVKSR